MLGASAAPVNADCTCRKSSAPGASARAAGAARLVLTHVWPTVDLERSEVEGSDAYGEPVQMAATNEVYSL